MTKGILSGKHALVTGGLGSIGLALVAGFAAAGARVTVLDRPDLTPLEGHGWLGVDLNDLSAAQAKVAAAGPFDILVNNAALIINKPFEDFTLEDYDTQMRVNSSATFALTRACAPGMKANCWGRVINMTSLTLNGQWDGYVPYVASKGAMLGLTKGLARELGAHGITVNAIAPGAVVSEAENRVFGDRLAEYNAFILKNQSVKTRILAEDVANLAVFLASDGARMICGQNIGIDGGW
ncbi:MAG: SDR family oxidoreductase [Pseudomonadota bacterium]|jgi:NAD(P)-dependent dehydrogenase (short-subunit alcohol dehydrogenase family)